MDVVTVMECTRFLLVDVLVVSYAAIIWVVMRHATLLLKERCVTQNA